MSFAPLVSFCLAFLLLAQTIAFGIAYRRCTFALDFPSQISHNARIINNSGKVNASTLDCRFRTSPDLGRSPC